MPSKTDSLASSNKTKTAPSAEYLLPTAVAGEMEEGRLTVKVVTTDESWIGVTNPADLQIARTALKWRGGGTT